MKLAEIYNNIILENTISSPLRGNYRISSKFGIRNGEQHSGVDLATPQGSPIYAPMDGVVVSGGGKDTGFHNNYCGGTIRLNHGNGVTSRYCHVSKIVSKQNGFKFKKGEIIGYTGGKPNTRGAGRSSGPHLHFELKINGQLVDPLKYINTTNLTLKPKVNNRVINLKDIIKNNNNTELISYGSQGSGVREIQSILKRLGYDLGPKDVDGVFGDFTKQAVSDFQRDNNIKIDGIVGIETAKKML